MFALIGWGLDAVIIFLLFGVMSKLDDISRRLSQLQKEPKTPAADAPPA